MRIIADFHIHSKYSRACSKELELPAIAAWCHKKGINVVSIADFTHPAWYAQITKQLVECEDAPGLYRLREGETQTRFICSTELSCIYSRGGKTRRVHNIVFAPSLSAAAAINAALAKRGAKLASDGRPIIGLDSEELLKIILNVSADCFLVPAHAWTPWFAIFGSKSGFDSIEECFGDFSSEITAIETGLSSDPAMNWRLSALDQITLISNSDAHSLQKLGREATVFEGDRVSYRDLVNAMRKRAKPKSETALTLTETLEFFPEEGKYHVDGHRECGIVFDPAETKKQQGICPRCKRPLTVGVLNRVATLADRATSVQPPGVAGFKSVVPLEEIIAAAFGVGVQSKKVRGEYERIVAQVPEFSALVYQSFDTLAAFVPEKILAGIKNVRSGNVKVTPGYDGVFGIVDAFGNEEKRDTQGVLFRTAV